MRMHPEPVRHAMKVLSPISSPSILSGPGSACVICGFAEIRTDAVFDRGWVLLSECPRCTHRATQPLAAPAQPLRVRVHEAPVAA